MIKSRTTHTCATLEIPEEMFKEIANRLIAAGYQHVFLKTVTGVMIDMTGIALVSEEEKEPLILPLKSLDNNVVEKDLNSV